MTVVVLVAVAGFAVGAGLAVLARSHLRRSR
jgi:hypothetical protein